jgi:hypothetical protein
MLDTKVSRKDFLKILVGGSLALVGAKLSSYISVKKTPISSESFADNGSSAPQIGGRWDRSTNLPGFVGMHIAVLHTGRVLLFSYDEGGYVPPPIPPNPFNVAPPSPLRDLPDLPVQLNVTEAHRTIARICISAADPNRSKCAIWDPQTGAAEELILVRALFCSGHSFLADGSLFVASGQYGIPAWARRLLAALRNVPPSGTGPTLATALSDSITNPLPDRFRDGYGASRDLHRFIPDNVPNNGRHTVPVPYWERLLPDMQDGRWYPSVVTLPDGRVMVISGTSATLGDTSGRTDGTLTGVENTMQIFDPSTLNRQRKGRSNEEVTVPLPREPKIYLHNYTDPNNSFYGGHFYIYHWYPFLHVLPSGHIFVHSKRRTALYNPATNIPDGERWTFPVGLTNYTFSRTGSGPGTSVLLPLIPTIEGDNVIYPQGRILILGGGGAEHESLPREIIGRLTSTGTNDRTPVNALGTRILDNLGHRAPARPEARLAEESVSWCMPLPTAQEISNNSIAIFPPNPRTGTGSRLPGCFIAEPQELKSETDATNTAEILDFNMPHPAWRMIRPMHNARVMPDAVILPDGNILVVNGCRKGRAGGLGLNFPWLGYNMGASNPVMEPELFNPVEETWTIMNSKSIYRLYHGTAALLPDGRVLTAGHDGVLNGAGYRTSQYQLEIFSPPYLFRGIRPIIEDVPRFVQYNTDFSIVTSEPENISSVMLIRQSSVTHNLNTDQRCVGLAILSRQWRQHPYHLRVKAPPNGAVAPPGYYMLFILDHDNVPSIAKWVRVGQTHEI